MTINFSNNSIPENILLLSMHAMGSMAVLAWNFNSKHLKPLLVGCAGIAIFAACCQKEPGLDRVDLATSLLGSATTGFIVGGVSLLLTAMNCSKTHLNRIGADTPEKAKAHIVKSFIVMDAILSILTMIPLKELSSQSQR